MFFVEEVFKKIRILWTSFEEHNLTSVKRENVLFNFACELSRSDILKRLFTQLSAKPFHKPTRAATFLLLAMGQASPVTAAAR